MKKFLCLFLTACMLCSMLAACTGNPDDPSTETQSEGQETSGEPSDPDTGRTEENTSAPDAQESEPVETTTTQPDEPTTSEPDETTSETDAGDQPDAIVITFDYNVDDMENVTVTDPAGGVVTLPEVGPRRGYSFGGWYRDSGFALKAEDGEIVTASRTYYARWIYVGEQFEITYSVDDQIIETVYAGKMSELTLRGYLSEDQSTVLDVWVDADGNTYQAGMVITIERDMALVARLATASAISFDAAGGTGTPPETNYYTRNTYITLPNASLVKDGDKFVAWQDNYGTVYVAGERYNVTSSMTFTALYAGNKKVTFDLAGGTGTDMSGTYQYQETITLPAAPEREGYTFMAWYDGKLEYVAGATYKVGPADTVITALWVEDATVVFHMNFDGVEDVYRTVRVSVNGTLDSFGDAPELRDHHFVGWYKEPDLQRQAYVGDVITGDTHYYAKWEHTYFIFTLTPDETGYYLSCENFRTIDYDYVRASEAFDPETGIITLPSEYNGLPVVSLLPVDAGDFSPIVGLYNTYYGSPCKGVVIPKEWTVIPDSAFDFCQTLETVIFEDINAVTEFGTNAFYNCLALTDFTFPPNLEKIGDSCFLYSGIDKVDLRNTKITEIPSMAFMRCFRLTELYLPENLVSIGDFAFQNSYNLPSVTFPDTLESIGGWAFGNAVSINTVDENLINGGVGHTSADIPLYNETNKDESTGEYVTEYYHSILGDIVIPESVTTIGKGAFALCENIKNITFEGESQLTELSDYVFYGTSITAIDIPETVTKIGNGVFKECAQLASISISKNVKSLGYKAFGNATSLADVTFAPDSVLDLNYFYTFSGCTALTEITLPASVKEIGDYTFVNCSNLAKVNFPADSQLLIVGKYAFAQSGLTEVKLPDTVKIIMDGAYEGLEKLIELEVPAAFNSGTWTIIYEDQENGIFNPRVEVYDAKLHDAYIRYPGVGDWMFYMCTSIESVTFAKQSADMTPLQYLGGWMFGGCSSLESVTLPASLTTLDSLTALAEAGYGHYTVSPFLDCNNLTEILVDADSTYLKTMDGDVYSYDGTIFFLHPLGDTTEELIIPEGVTEVAAYAFYENNHIKHIVFPKTMHKLGTYALAWNNALEEVEFLSPEMTEFGFGAMYNITLYPSVTLANGYQTYDFNQKPVSTPLVRIIFHSTTVPELGTSVWVHSTENPNFTIFVPDEVLDDYKAHEDWTDYASYLKGLSALVR